MDDPPLEAAALRALLRVAAEAIRRHVEPTSDDVRVVVDAEAPVRDAFVTLHRDGVLAGCIGRLGATDPLPRLVSILACSAATEDPRFSPVRQRDLPGLEIEVSVLSSLSVASPETFEPGRHGLMLELHGRRGLLLPQVATEHHLDRESFLAALCRKTGVPVGAWKDPDAQLLGFEVQCAHARFVDLVADDDADAGSGDRELHA